MRTRSVYSILVKSLLILALIVLTIGGLLVSVGLPVGYEITKLGLWMLIAIPLLPIISISLESLKERDLALLAVAVIVIFIIIANLVYHGFGKLPFLTLPLLPL